MFPTVIDDNFFNNPYNIKNFVNTLDFTEKNKSYPGIRTQCISNIDFNLFNNIFLKVLSNFYNPDELYGCNFSGSLYAQKINEVYESGWIHTDYPFLMSFIIYLDINADISTGTSIYHVKNEYSNDNSFNTLEKHSEFKEHCYENYCEESIKNLEKHRLENNQPFAKSIEVSNVFNTMVAFSSNKFHTQTKMTSGNRTTLVGFLQTLSLPLPNSKKHMIYI